MAAATKGDTVRVGVSAGPTLSAVIADVLTRYPDREAFVAGGRRLTYRQCSDLVGRLTAMYAARGVGAGSSVVMLSPNRPESWLAAAAAYLLGATFTGLQSMGTTEDHVFICDDAEASVLVVDETFVERGEAIREGASTLKHVIVLGRDGNDELAGVRPLPLSAGPAGEEDVSWLQYTGGTTGRPKGVMLGVRCRTAMLGYRNLADETAATLKDGWLRSGDMARQDDEGYLYIVDRKKDMIISGGFNIYAREVEDVLAAHPAVANSAVIGIPDDKVGRGRARRPCDPGWHEHRAERAGGFRQEPQGLPVRAEEHRGHRRPAHDHRRQGRQEGAAHPLLGRAGPPDPLSRAGSLRSRRKRPDPTRPMASTLGSSARRRFA
jgi:acyl-CoA synthetase (AMP-forming)/AMP-acid ligase II